MTARTILAAGGGFLLAVLWFDLMFDVQALGRPAGPLPEAVLASTAAYYRRVTTTASPMGSLVGAVMVVTVATAAVRLARGPEPRGWRIASLVLVAAPVLLAMLRVFPNAVELGARSGTPEAQSALARAILVDHLLCLGSIGVFLALQLLPARAASAGVEPTPGAG